ncbi:GlxA family transcriptional regulator [Aliiroseovarius sp.]|uniref:GlxA family transcriptional regulator n=1 Tax=Aliiroseovarius sp. TaxID=1872442 RepID=UPI003BA8636D
MHVTFLLMPRFQMLAWVLATETLRIANKCAGRELFSWQTLSATRGPVAASNGALVTPDGDWDAPADLTLICAGYEPLAALTPSLSAWLTRRARSGMLGGLDTGTMVLARLGLLAGHRAVLHAEAEGAFREAYPEIEVSPELYCLDAKRLTAAGGTATADAMLAWIEAVTSPALARATAEAMGHGRIRPGGEPQRARTPADPVLARMHAVMGQSLAEPLSLTEIATRCGVSPKVLRARCLRHLGCLPRDHYMALRLRHADELLTNTTLPVGQIALACGFATPASFARAYLARRGHSPSAARLPSPSASHLQTP